MDAILQWLSSTEISNGLTILDIILTIVGFSAAVVASIRSKNAAEKAELAVKEVQQEIRRMDTVSDLASAISAMEEIRRFQRENVLHYLPDRYSAARKSLVSINGANSRLNTDQRAKVNLAIRQLSIQALAIEKSLSNQEVLNSARINDIISRQIDACNEVLVEVRNSIGGKQHGE